MRKTQEQVNPDYFSRVRKRTEEKENLDCFEQIRRLLASHSPIGTCLDVGCASGYLFHHIGDLVSDYHGLDSSPLFVEYGRRKLGGRFQGRFTLHCEWFENFAAQADFDALVCIGLFYAFPNYHWYLDEMLRITRKVVVIRSLFADQTLYRYVPASPGASVWKYYNIYGKDEISQFASERGWQAVWHEDDHVRKCGGHYETAGLPFPFAFLELVAEL